MTCYAERSADRIHLSFPYSEGDIAKAKTVPGCRWAAGTKTWTYPLSVETCLGLRKAFGVDLEVGGALALWFHEGKVQRDVQETLANATDAELTYLPARAPKLAATLRPDQRVGAVWFAKGYRGGGLLADKPGLGKTLETIAGMLERPEVTGRHLIICPKISTRLVWQREWKKWAPGYAVYAAKGTRPQREEILADYLADTSSFKVLVVVAEMLCIKETKDIKPQFAGYEYPELFALQWDSVTIDESQRWLGSLTIAKGTLAGKGLKRLLYVPGDGQRRAVTATPFGKGGRVQGMFGTLHWLWPDEFTSFWRWADTYFQVEDETIRKRGGSIQVKRIGELRQGTEEEFLLGFGPRILRRTKEEVLKHLPPKWHVEVPCEMTAKQAKQMRQLKDDAEITTPGGMITVNGALAELTRAKQVADGMISVSDAGDVVFVPEESGKLDMLMEKLEARGILSGDGDTKVLVASQFNRLLDAVEARLVAAEVGYYVLTGDTSEAKREALVDSFQNAGGPRVVLINAKAAGLSITLDAADEMHCLDELWNPEDQEQLEDRIHRASRIHQVTIFQYRSEDTVDQYIAEMVEAKRFDQHRVMDGRRGLAYTRSLIRGEVTE